MAPATPQSLIMSAGSEVIPSQAAQFRSSFQKDKSTGHRCGTCVIFKTLRRGCYGKRRWKRSSFKCPAPRLGKFGNNPGKHIYLTQVIRGNNLHKPPLVMTQFKNYTICRIAVHVHIGVNWTLYSIDKFQQSNYQQRAFW